MKAKLWSLLQKALFVIAILMALGVSQIFRNWLSNMILREECKTGYEAKKSFASGETVQLGGITLKFESDGTFQSLSGDKAIYQGDSFIVTEPGKNPSWVVFRCERFNTYAFWDLTKLQEFYSKRAYPNAPEIELK